MAESMGLEQVPRVALQEAKRRFDDGSALFVDVRPVDEYRAGHIPGAASIPPAMFTLYFTLPRDREIIPYCT